MEAVKFKLNQARTELINFGAGNNLTKTTHTTINVIGKSIKR